MDKQHSSVLVGPGGTYGVVVYNSFQEDAFCTYGLEDGNLQLEDAYFSCCLVEYMTSLVVTYETCAQVVYMTSLVETCGSYDDQYGHGGEEADIL